MPQMKRLARTTLGVAASIILTAGAIKLLDTGLGVAQGFRPAPETVQLIFPPFSRQAFQTIDFDYEVEINALGIRQGPVSIEKTGATRICLIGDSTTFGYGVAEPETWVRQLEQLLREEGYLVETLNLGKPGAGPVDYAEFAARALPLLQPDVVIVCISLDDMPQSDEAIRSGYAGPATPPRVHVVARALPNISRTLGLLPPAAATVPEPPLISTAEENRLLNQEMLRDFMSRYAPVCEELLLSLEPEVQHAFTGGLLNPSLLVMGALSRQGVFDPFLLGDLEHPVFQRAMASSCAHLKQIKALAGRQGAEFLALGIPAGMYVNDHSLSSYRRIGMAVPDGLLGTDAGERGLRGTAECAEIPFLSVADAFLEHMTDDMLFFAFDNHLTAFGHALLASALARQLPETLGTRLARQP